MNGDPSRMPRPHGPMQFYAQRGFEHHGGHHWLALLLLLILVVALLLIAASVVRLALAKGVTAPADDALSILRLRYARGEVAREEFLLAHGDLGGSAPPGDAHPA